MIYSFVIKIGCPKWKLFMAQTNRLNHFYMKQGKKILKNFKVKTKSEKNYNCIFSLTNNEIKIMIML